MGVVLIKSERFLLASETMVKVKNILNIIQDLIEIVKFLIEVKTLNNYTNCFLPFLSIMYEFGNLLVSQNIADFFLINF